MCRLYQRCKDSAFYYLEGQHIAKKGKKRAIKRIINNILRIKDFL